MKVTISNTPGKRRNGNEMKIYQQIPLVINTYHAKQLNRKERFFSQINIHQLGEMLLHQLRLT